MEDYNKSDRYRNDRRSSSNERNFDMNWDRNYNPGDDYGNGPDTYSSDRERAYWNARDQMNERANRNDNYRNRNYDQYSNNAGGLPRGQYNEFTNQSYHNYNPNYSPNERYNPSYMNDRNNNFRGRSDRYYSKFNNAYYDDRYNDRGNDWRDNERGWWDRTKDEVASWFGDEDAERRRRRDEMNSGQHRGKGPKNYTRSEERIKEDVSDALSEDSFLDASGIEVSVKEGEVTLNGEVDSRYSKHRAEDLSEDVTGVTNVQNNLRVVENVGNTIYKDSANNGNRPITTNTHYDTTKNRKDFING
jgi:hypothetical protein